MPHRPSYALHPHPAVAGPAAVQSIAVRAAFAPDGALALSFVLQGEIDRIAIPAAVPAEPADRLWEHTCFEAFVRAAGSRAYREFNFSPSGQWAVYSFAGYRERDDALRPAVAVPRMTVRRQPDRLEADVVLAPSLLPDADGAAYQLGLSAVVEAADGSRSYWALAHPSSQPDFHHRGAFALTLAAPRLPS